jgi:hypothetical protein
MNVEPKPWVPGKGGTKRHRACDCKIGFKLIGVSSETRHVKQPAGCPATLYAIYAVCICASIVDHRARAYDNWEAGDRSLGEDRG